MKKIVLAIVIAGFAAMSGCTGLDSVSPASRNTWMYFYGGLGNYQAVSAEQTADGGYLIVGDSISPSNSGITVIKTDRNGNQVWRKDIIRGSASGLKVDETGYFIIGSGIYVNLAEPIVALQNRHIMRLLKLNPDGSTSADILSGDTSVANYNGNAVTFHDNNLYTVSDRRNFIGNTNLTSIITTFDRATLTPLDTQSYNLEDRDYVNSRSIHRTEAGDLTWALSAEFTNANAVRSFIRLPVLSNNTFTNGDNVGNVNENFQVADVQPSATSFGLIGTYATTTGTKSNVFFVRTVSASDLTLQTENLTFYDAGEVSEKENSKAEDEGLALIGTSDGGYLLGCSTTTTETGQDILLIRIDFTGKILWKKTIGGTGNEILSSIRTTSDGGYIMSGTLDLAGLKSMFLLKTNADGELKN